jgi:hypothetical protein
MQCSNENHSGHWQTEEIPDLLVKEVSVFIDQQADAFV